MRQRGFGAVELFVITILVVASALGGYFVYKSYQVDAPETADVSIAAVPVAPEINSASDVSSTLSNIDNLDISASLNQLDQLDADLQL